jgi:hypothetical protein
MSNSRSSSAQVSLRVAIPADLLHQEVEGKTVLLDLRGERYYSLDETGTRIWALLAEHGHTDAVCAHLMAMYDVDEEKLREDVNRFILGLVDNGLITVAEDPPNR